MSGEQRVSGDGMPLPPDLFRSGLSIGTPLDECRLDELLPTVDPGPPPWWDDAASGDGVNDPSAPTDPLRSDDDAGPPQPEWCSARSGPVAWLERYGRERSRLLASMLTAMHAIAHPDGGSARRHRVGDAIDQIAARMGWSRSMAGTWLTLAEEVIDRLPALHLVLSAGTVDEVKVRTIAECTRDMPDDLARAVTLSVLPSAATTTRYDLIETITTHAAAIDSEWARRREQAARARVRVTATRTPQGTTDVAVRDLGVDHGRIVMARIEHLAIEVRRGGRVAGTDVGIHAVRALVSLRMQDGSCVGLDDDAFVEELVTQLPAWLEENRGPDADDDGSPNGSGSTGPDDSGPGDSGPGDEAEPEADGVADDESDDGTSDDSTSDDGTSDDGTDTHPADPATAFRTDHGSEESTDPEFDRRPATIRTGTTEVRLRLSTALGLDDRPGRLPGTGMVTAPTARRLLERARGGDLPVEWRLVLTDDDGLLEYVLLVRPDPPPRPRGPRRARDRRRGRLRGRMIVELAAPTTMLLALDRARDPDWALFIDRALTCLADLRDDERPGGAAHPATSVADAAKRHPGRELDRYIRIRDRHCIGVMCTRPARSAELDHTRDWIDHGPTIACNLGAGCSRCHRLKHEHGWRLDQPTPGRFVWQTPAGARHTTGARPILDQLPDPSPPVDGRPRAVVDVEPPFGDDVPPWIDRGGGGVITSVGVPVEPDPSSVVLLEDPPF